MHEMAYVNGIVKTSTRLAKQYNVDKIATVTVEIGELSGVVPSYLTSMWSMGTEGTVCDGAELIINESRCHVRCFDCGEEYLITDHLTEDEQPVCPNCGKKRFEVLSGSEVNIVEIGVMD